MTQRTSRGSSPRLNVSENISESFIVDIQNTTWAANI